MSDRNSVRLKILSAISIFLLVALQYVMYEQNEHAIVSGKNFIYTRGKIIEHKPFEEIVVEYKQVELDTIIQVRKGVGNNYDPFVGIELGQDLPITFDKEDYDLFYINGYEDRPSSFQFYFIFFFSMIVQVLLFLVLIDFLDKDLQRKIR